MEKTFRKAKQTKCMSTPVEQYEKIEAIQWIGKKEKQYIESGKTEGTEMKRNEKINKGELDFYGKNCLHGSGRENLKLFRIYCDGKGKRKYGKKTQ